MIAAVATGITVPAGTALATPGPMPGAQVQKPPLPGDPGWPGEKSSCRPRSRHRPSRQPIGRPWSSTRRSRRRRARRARRSARSEPVPRPARAPAGMRSRSSAAAFSVNVTTAISASVSRAARHERDDAVDERLRLRSTPASTNIVSTEVVDRDPGLGVFVEDEAELGLDDGHPTSTSCCSSRSLSL